MTPQIDFLGKMNTVLRVSTPTYAVSKQIDRKNIHFSTKPSHVTPQINHFGKTSPVLRVSTHIYGVFSGDRWQTMFIFRVNLVI